MVGTSPILFLHMGWIYRNMYAANRSFESVSFIQINPRNHNLM